MELSKRIKELRINKGLTQTDLSDKSGISLRTIQRIENNEVSNNLNILERSIVENQFKQIQLEFFL